MKDFISEIRKIPTDRVLYTFSRISIDMFKKLECQKPVPLVVERNGRVMRGEVLLTGWDIHSIMYLSVKHSNDYRNCNKMISVPEIINLFRRYDDENSAAEDLRASQLDGVFRILMGMTSEQFLFQQPGLVFEKFNRDYYILLAANSFEHRHLLDVNSVVDSIFGYSANDYIAVLLMVFWLCSQSPDPISVIDSANLDNVSRLLSKEKLTKFIQYYSCTYNELRESKLGKQMLYSKPFIKTQNTGAYITANMFFVLLIVGNGLYWLVRDYYLKKGSQHFINSFGLLFEDYITDLAQRYCKEGEYRQLSQGKQKGADFLVDLGSILLLIEAKSGVLPLSVKQQVPNVKQANQFFDRTIQEAYDQLQSSYNSICNDVTTPIAKIILLYDDFSNAGIIEKSITEIFDKDPMCFLMTIRELEILLYLNKNDHEKKNAICERLVSEIEKPQKRETISEIFKSLEIYDNPHLSGEMDYFQKMLAHLSKLLYQSEN